MLRNQDLTIPETKPDRFGLKILEIIKSPFLTIFLNVYNNIFTVLLPPAPDTCPLSINNPRLPVYIICCFSRCHEFPLLINALIF
ncbi:hypothetical protein BGP_0385 [Beggiatoa sp. PS]|nr:hypothetical protein BGP_0385 [Beggiatoa sp. PS]